MFFTYMLKDQKWTKTERQNNMDRLLVNVTSLFHLTTIVTDRTAGKSRKEACSMQKKYTTNYNNSQS